MRRLPLLLAALPLALAACAPEVNVGDRFEDTETGQTFSITQTSPDCDALAKMAQQHFSTTQAQHAAGNAPVAEIQTDFGAGGPCVYYLTEPEGKRIFQVRTAAALAGPRFRRL